MTKRKPASVGEILTQEFIEPMGLMDAHGADAVRWFFAASGSPWGQRRIGPNVLDERVHARSIVDDHARRARDDDADTADGQIAETRADLREALAPRVRRERRGEQDHAVGRGLVQELVDARVRGAPATAGGTPALLS